MATVLRITSPEHCEERVQWTQPKRDGSGTANISPSSLSRFETIIATHQPVWESLVLQLPTPAILELYHTSRYLRSFLRACPTAWSALSFRKLSITPTLQRYPSPASDSSGEVSTTRSKPYALDQLLISVVIPFGTCIRSLDLDQTAVSGHTLTSSILPARRETLQQLSVRGCKNVSIRYHILPYLSLFKLQTSIEMSRSSLRTDRLALKSLYTFRCRHHRRRPYLATSLFRRDSDAEPTHELIKICRDLDIWTDTAWCPTPGGRCSRRRGYFTARGLNNLENEVWVVFDRLWRSGNRIGCLRPEEPRSSTRWGRLWQDDDYGYQGEALGTEDDASVGEGKLTATHLRQCHKRFIEDYKCHACGDMIPERCEQCSIMMHCMGCRKTLCASCAYEKPLPPSMSSHRSDDTFASEERLEESFWWAPHTRRSPNLMNQEIAHESSTPATNSLATPPIRSSWCCLRPQFSISGSITLAGPGIGPDDASRLRTAPLPQKQGYEDPEFKFLRQSTGAKSYLLETPRNMKAFREGRDPMLYWLLHNGVAQLSMCPRNLCTDCSGYDRWKAQCHHCQETICFAHDLRGLKARICGYRDLSIEDRVMKEDMLNVAQDALERNHSQIRSVHRIREHLQEHGTLDAQCEYELAVVTELPATDDEDLQECRDTVFNDARDLCRTEPIAPTSAFAVLPFRPKPFNRSSGPLNTNDPWRGCASFTCPEVRSMADYRPLCRAVIRKCIECKVNVCPVCVKASPPCDCSYCKNNYHCPNCFPNFGLKHCKKAEEIEHQRREEDAQLRKAAIQAELDAAKNAMPTSIPRSNSMPESVGEWVGDFFAGLEALNESPGV